MNVRVEFDHGEIHLDMGDTFELTREINASGPMAEMQAVKPVLPVLPVHTSTWTYQ
jgi:hypothetical protein